VNNPFEDDLYILKLL